MTPPWNAGLDRAWYPVAWSHELTRSRPLARVVLGQEVVLFRGPDGRPAALDDCCPHRNVALSLGRVEGGALRCAYHGWCFNSSGAVSEAPCAARGEPLPRAKATAFRAAEQQGTVWVCLGDGADGPPRWAGVDEAGYASFEVVTLIRCGLEPVLVNFVDCGHTGFVHAGLFRKRPHQDVTAALEETADGVRIETLGENDPGSLLSKVLLARGGAMRHVDAFMAPHTVRVDYWLGGSRHVVSTSICTPESAGVTRVFTRVAVRAWPLTAGVMRVLRRTTRQILEQDRVVLESQQERLAARGARFCSMEADAPTAWVSRALARYRRALELSAEPRRERVTYRL